MNPTPTPQTQQTEDAQFYRNTLHKLIDLASNIAQSLHDEATEKLATYAPRRTPEETQALTLAFDRIARCIRRTILLAQHVTKPPRPELKPREAARKRILREVEDAIQRDAPAKKAAALHTELLERLDAPELAESLDDDIAARPVDEIIADIIRDLGLAASPGTHPWQRRTPKDIATLNARAAAPPRGIGPPTATTATPTRTPGQHPAAP